MQLQTAISIRPYVILHSEKYFHRPHDFCPERWLDTDQCPEEFRLDRLSASQPFSVGSTSCLGKPLAMAEMRLLIAKLVWCFQFAMTKEKPFSWESQRMMMIVEKDPLWLTLKKRASK